MSADDPTMQGAGERIDARLVRDFIACALAHDALADPVRELLYDHVVEGRHDPSVIAVSLKRLLTEILATATALDWRAVAGQVIDNARHTLGEPTEPAAIAIDQAQRAAIHPHVISDLGIAISEANVALECGEWAAVQALRCRIEQDMRLLDDIGWGNEDPGGHFELTIPHATLQLTIKRLHASASALTRELLADVLDGAGLRVLHTEEALAALHDDLAQTRENPSA
jgi:hypothetical protein